MLSALLDRIYPELDRFPTQDAKRLAMRRAKNLRNLSGAYGLWLVLAGTLFFGWLISAWLHSVAHQIVRMIVATLLGMLMTIGVLWSISLRIRMSLRRQLLELGMPICLTCGYDLSGAVSNVCPECGNKNALL